MLPHDSLAALLRGCRRAGAQHVLLFGSAIRQGLAAASDVDLHVVVPAMDRPCHAVLVGAGEASARSEARRLGRSWRVELRHGPLKPDPSDGPVLQLHLVLDDLESLRLTPCVVLARRAAAGRLLVGEPIRRLRADCDTRATLIGEARSALSRWLQALRRGRIPFRQWSFESAPTLVEASEKVETDWQRELLLRGAAGASDLHYLTLAFSDANAAVGRDHFRRPMLSLLEENDPLPVLVRDSWDDVRSKAAEIVERRRDALPAG